MEAAERSAAGRKIEAIGREGLIVDVAGDCVVRLTKRRDLGSVFHGPLSVTNF
jgi:hypothetical protein